MFHVPEKYRITRHNALLLAGSRHAASDASKGCNGTFAIPPGNGRRELSIIASDEGGWEHVSIHAWSRSRGTAIPNWEEMCFVKDVFWDAEDTVVQFHPPKSEYVNNHPHVLHLWRCIDGRETPRPPYWMVGSKEHQSRKEATAEADKALAEWDKTHAA